MHKFPDNPSLYEINTRVWLRQFDKPGRRATLRDVPDNFWANLQNKGMHIVWLMGVWKINARALHENDLSAELQSGYDQALPDWQEDDVIGSPYAIDEYIVADDLGGPEALKHIRQQLAKFDLRLMLDFVPNHFSRATCLLSKQPGIFVSPVAESERPGTFNPELFFVDKKTQTEFAHGRDPFFAPWWDTVQVNYAATEARNYMTGVLQSIASQCDGVRCDMAMLVMNEIFAQTWNAQISLQMPATEFWVDAIGAVKSSHPNFIFMAEAYWDKEWDLQQQGFDYTYDKRLTDRLEESDLAAVQGHLHADNDFQTHSVRFIENHDEPRAVAVFGRERAMAAAVIISTLPGMHFYYDGQFEGKAVRLPVQLGRERLEQTDAEFVLFFEKLLGSVKSPIIHFGDWQLLTSSPAWQENESYSNVLAWQWCYQGRSKLVVVNFSDQVCQARLFMQSDFKNNEIKLVDDLTGEEYLRDSNEIKTSGLYIELQPYHSHIFSYQE